MLERFRKAAPYLALACGVLVLSFSALFVRWADAPGTVTSFYRMASATIIFLPIFGYFKSRSPLPGWGSLLIPALAGFFSALDHSLWSTALGITRVANATLFNNFSPIWVALIAVIFLRQKLGMKFWLGLTLGLAGAVIVFGENLVRDPALSSGDGLAILSSIFYAGFFLTVQWGRKRMSTLTFTFFEVLFCAIFLLFVNLLLGHHLSGYSTTTYLVFIAAGLVSQVIGYFSITYALGHVPAAIVAPTMISQPIITALLAYPLLGEELTTAQWVGGAAVLAGVYIVNRSQVKSTEKTD